MKVSGQAPLECQNSGVLMKQDQSVYITNLFIYSVRAVISGLQWFSRNRQKSKYPVSRHEFSSFCIFIIPTFHFPLR